MDETGVYPNGVLAYELGHTSGLIHPFQFLYFKEDKNERIKFNDRFVNGNNIYLRGQNNKINFNNFMQYSQYYSNCLVLNKPYTYLYLKY